jgi:holo-[acyl-carrier protein] synthase
MSIYGIGVDVVEVGRIASAIEDLGDAFLDRLFTAGERGFCDRQKRPELHYAARFAAKEAVAKAFGCGIGGDLEWLDMDIVRLDSGQPVLVLGGAGQRFAERHRITEVKISLAHADCCAVANAIAILGP